eukprot:c16688_g1_i1 orf=216-500(+)
MLDKVHTCTLHDEMRIIDKLLHLHICYAYNIKNKEKSLSTLRKIEAILNEIGIQGGHVRIVKDNELSSLSNDVPTKISMGGTKARQFLSSPNAQ